MKPISYKNYVAGWLDSSIHDFLGTISLDAQSAKYALITCLDSNLNPATLKTKSPELRSLGSKVSVLGSGLLVPSELLVNADLRKQIFFGFDEVWFFPSKNINPKPTSISLVGPARLDRGRLRRIGKWMTDNSCDMGLGGGEGLNFVVQAHGLVKDLLGHTIEQPQPVLVT